MPKKVLVLLCVSLLSILLTLVGVEGMLRIAVRSSYKLSVLTQTPFYVHGMESVDTLDELFGLTGQLIPPGGLINGFVTNSKGFLSPEYPYEKPAHTYRIVLVGDSYAVGVIPYKQHFIRVLEEKLKTQLEPGQKLEVINLGMPSIGPSVYERMVAVEAMKYHPDLVLVSFFVGNDFFDDVEVKRPTVLSNNEQPPTFFSKWKTLSLLKNLYHTHVDISSIVAKVENHSKGAVLGTYTGQGVDQYSPDEPSFTESKFIETESFKTELFDPLESIYDDSLPNIQKAFSMMKNDVSSSPGTKLVVLISPDEMQINPVIFQKAFTGKSQVNLNTSLPQERLDKVLSDEGISFIDLLPDFRNDRNARNLYQPRDTHFNVAGNAKAADILYEQLGPGILKDLKNTK